MNRHSIGLLLAGSAALAAFAVVADIVPPHLSWTEDPQTTVTFSWQRELPGRGTVRYGSSTNYEFSVSDSGGYRAHSIIIRNLEPDSVYHYRISSSDGFDGGAHTFRTAPGPTSAVHFAVHGDLNGGVSPSWARTVVEQIVADDPAFVIHTGDLSDEVGANGFSTWTNFLTVATDELERAVFMPAAGNHDDSTDATALYWRFFNLPESPATGRLYSFDAGNIHFVVLNSEQSTRAQTNWLQLDLQAAANNTNIEWIIPYFHRPPYTQGSSHGPALNVRTNWCPLFVKYEADIVFSGHNHSYERTLPTNGITYVVAGGGGALLYAVTSNAGFHAFATSCYHYVSISVTGRLMNYLATRSDGAVFDRVVFTNNGRAVRVSPAFPLRDESVRISYSASNGPLAAASPVYLHLGIDAFTNALVDAAMTWSAASGRWEYDTTVPTNAGSRIAFAFRDATGSVWDNNYGYNWQALIDRVKFAPSPAVAGSNLTIRYDAGMGPLSGSTQLFMRVGYNRWFIREPADLEMTNSGGAWEYTLAVPSYASRVDVDFIDGTNRDGNSGLSWFVAAVGASCEAPWPALPMVAHHTPDIPTNPPVIQNEPGDNFDFDTAGTPLRSGGDSGFGSFGDIYFNYDASYLYVGGVGANLGGSNNVFVLFLGFDTMTNSADNLWHMSGLPNTLDFMHNIGFTEPMDVAIVFGDEYGDDPDDTTFTYGGYDFGQGVYHIGTNWSSFQAVPGARLSQFDGTGMTACATSDDDGDRRTERWEARIPWVRLKVTNGIGSLSTLLAAGVIGSDSEDGTNRYLSSRFIGRRAFAPKDVFGQFARGFVTIEPALVSLPGGDYDGDGLPNLWEHQYFGSVGGPAPGGDQDGDGLDNLGEYTAGTEPTNAASFFSADIQAGDGTFVVSWPGAADRRYDVEAGTNLPGPFSSLATNLVGTSYTDSVIGVEKAFYRVKVRY